MGSSCNQANIRVSSKTLVIRRSCIFLAQKHSFAFILFGSALLPFVISQDVYAFRARSCGSPWPCSYEVAQQSSSPALPQSSGNPPPSLQQTIVKTKDSLTNNIAEQSQRVTDLRKTNNAWNIAFVAIGVSMTLLATALGAVGSASEKAKARTTITIAVIGAIAAASQTIASKIPVAKRAGEYAKIQAALMSLNYKVKAATTQDELKSAQAEFEKQIAKIGEAEAAD